MKSLLVPMVFLLLSFAQEKKDCWQIFVNKQQVASGFTGNSTNVEIAAKSKDNIKITYSYNGGEPKWKRSIIIMDDKRKELWRKDLPSNSGKCTIAATTLKAITNNANFSIQTIAIPIDPSLAATIRVGTVLLCNVHWK
jgi:hypothetical protein